MFLHIFRSPVAFKSFSLFCESNLPRSLRLLELCLFNGYITRFIDGYGGITYYKRIAISSDTVLFIDESHFLHIRRQMRASYLTETLYTEFSYIFVNVFVVIVVVILVVYATPMTFQRLKNVVYGTCRRSGRSVCAFRLCPYS